jgi:hypothetical protein
MRRGIYFGGKLSILDNPTFHHQHLEKFSGYQSLLFGGTEGIKKNFFFRRKFSNKISKTDFCSDVAP